MKKHSNTLRDSIVAAISLILAGAVGITIAVNINNGKIKVKIDYAAEPAMISAEGKYSDDVPTIDSIDGGGKFQDMINVDGADPELYYELGSMEQVNTTSPEAFRDSTLGRCIVANNYFGAQCVSLARAFWWDYAGFDVSTCGTGLAKGMMNCAEENAKDKFQVIWNTDEIINGTWIVLDGQTTGHICMALGSVQNGYVQCLGENQGGIPCEGGIGGAGTNIINISVRDFIGGYIPITYIPPEPEPEPEPLAPDTGRQ